MPCIPTERSASTSSSSGLILALDCNVNLYAGLFTQHCEQILEFLWCELLVEVVRHERMFGIVDRPQLAFVIKMKLVLLVKNLDREVVVVPGNSADGFAMRADHTHRSIAGRDGQVLSQFFLEMRERNLGSDAGEIGADGSAFSANHVTLHASALRSDNGHSMFRVARDDIVRSSAAKITDIGDNPPCVLVCQAHV